MRFYGLILLISWQISGLHGTANLFGGKCNEICGITTQIPQEEPDVFRLQKRNTDDVNEGDYVDAAGHGDDTDIADEENRIVNGYQAKNRPWLVFMFTHGGLCGGVLINNLFVLSAAHCYCRHGPPEDPIKCEKKDVDGIETSQPMYDVSKYIDFYIGVNNKKLKEAKADKTLHYKAEKVWIRNGWVFNVGFSPDLSMAKLKKPVIFKPHVIAPICMPTEEDTENTMKERNKVYIAGWGAQFSACDTNDSGPMPNTMCKFPFVHNGKTHDFCTHEPTPAETDPICKKFIEWSKQVNQPIRRVGGTKGEAIPVKIQYGQGMSKYCFDTKVGGHNKMGWCGTCYRGLDSFNDEGKEGYCNPFDAERKSKPGETARPKVALNWGMCAEWCRPGTKQGASESLMETGVDLLDFDVCKTLGGELQFDEKREICAGKKKNFPIIDIFEMKAQCMNSKQRWRRRYRTKRDIRECFKKSNTAKPETYNYGIKTPFNFYLGGQDSCQGDSGGPLITFIRSNGTVRGHTIGAVSRGTGCANLNAPGIFSRVSHHLDWIKKIAGEGTC